jgi:hypothetical protein
MRLTRSLRTKGQRSTRKQKGGAEWYKTTFSEILSNFQQRLEKELDTEIVKKIMGIISPENTEKNVGNWFEVIRYQDILMRVGLEIALEKIDPIEYIKTVTDQTEVINKMVGIFKDLEGVIRLSTEPTNKFDMIFKVRDERALEISKLLLNPKRIENLLIQAVAQIIYMLHDEKNYEETLGPTDNQLLKENLINKWTYYTVNFIQNESNEEIRDAWVLGDKSVDEAGIRVFWTDFISELKTGTGPITSDNYGTLAAKLLRIHKEKKDIIDITNFGGKIEYSVDMPPENDTKGTVLEHIDVDRASFLFHLDGSVKVLMSSAETPS